MVKEFIIDRSISKEPSLIIKEQIMLTPGTWNGIPFTSESIEEGILGTDWTVPENSSLIKRHPTDENIAQSEDWLGYISNIRYLRLVDGVAKDGMYGDVYLYDTDLAKKIAYGKANLALSIDADYVMGEMGAENLRFTNTAMVYKPGCSDAKVQLSDNGGKNKVTFTSDKIKIQLEDEITDESSKGNSEEQLANQEIKKAELEDINIIKKEDKEKFKMENIKLDDRIDALEARISLLEGNVKLEDEKSEEETKEEESKEEPKEVTEETKEEPKEESKAELEEKSEEEVKEESTEESKEKSEEPKEGESKVELEELKVKVAKLEKALEEKTQLSEKVEEAAEPKTNVQLNENVQEKNSFEKAIARLNSEQ